MFRHFHKLCDLVSSSNSECPDASVPVPIQQSQWLPIRRLCPFSCLSYPDANSQRNLANEWDAEGRVTYNSLWRDKKGPCHTLLVFVASWIESWVNNNTVEKRSLALLSRCLDKEFSSSA